LATWKVPHAHRPAGKKGEKADFYKTEVKKFLVAAIFGDSHLSEVVAESDEHDRFLVANLEKVPTEIKNLVCDLFVKKGKLLTSPQPHCTEEQLKRFYIDSEPSDADGAPPVDGTANRTISHGTGNSNNEAPAARRGDHTSTSSISEGSGPSDNDSLRIMNELLEKLYSKLTIENAIIVTKEADELVPGFGHVQRLEKVLDDMLVSAGYFLGLAAATTPPTPHQQHAQDAPSSFSASPPTNSPLALNDAAGTSHATGTTVSQSSGTDGDYDRSGLTQHAHSSPTLPSAAAIETGAIAPQSSVPDNVFPLPSMLQNGLLRHALMVLPTAADAICIEKNELRKACEENKNVVLQTPREKAGAGMLWRFEHFRLVKKLGTGGTGSVFEAAALGNLSLSTVALKMELFYLEDVPKYFVRPFQCHAEICHHPNIVSFYGYFGVPIPGRKERYCFVIRGPAPHQEHEHGHPRYQEQT